MSQLPTVHTSAPTRPSHGSSSPASLQSVHNRAAMNFLLDIVPLLQSTDNSNGRAGTVKGPHPRRQGYQWEPNGTNPSLYESWPPMSLLGDTTSTMDTLPVAVINQGGAIASYEPLTIIQEDPSELAEAMYYPTASESDNSDPGTGSSDDGMDSCGESHCDPEICMQTLQLIPAGTKSETLHHEIQPISKIPDEYLDRSIIPVSDRGIKAWKCNFEECSDPLPWNNLEDVRTHVRKHLNPYWCTGCLETFAHKRSAERHQKAKEKAHLV